MIRTERSQGYRIRGIADRYEVCTPEGRVLAEYLSLDSAEWAVRHHLAPIPTEAVQRPGSGEWTVI
ncbi:MULTISPECIES: hypothetical protein [unclassified Streptomyces]|uniref:hypothetical protein n=1 Tax=unclassified Streptomyces TaxID=2593676 RepID=UPI0004C4E4FE|nr:hypothetical protein [Streptomyces sp. NRRL F-2747]